ncbi:hypothetical protein GCM10009555_007610 [Acrocarpospora macrocephala]|uniref:Uncharacterized protein n=1 Tax=Acrocarpospora macrocephala TaxID=150177 RepID=A0A5M3WU45_9ACTN|nr:phosphotransferase [Acrocarpospora macrocephala]GES12967.1 hypothetical protein Amac_065640 [Acrocarpospora macrocephala]
MRLVGRFGGYDCEDAPFARGGTASLYLAEGATLVGKCYDQPIVDESRIRMSGELCALGRNTLRGGVPVGSTVATSLCWPIDLIDRPDGAITGVILPALPGGFLRDKGTPRSLDFLLMRRAAPPPAEIRVRVVRRLAEVFAWLDELRLVHGDLSPKNVVWTADPEPAVCVIDVDGMSPRAPSTGVATPGWMDPRLVEGQIPAHDHFSDRYALALAIYRGLFLTPGNLDRRTDGTWPKPTAIPEGTPAGLRALLLATLGNPLSTEDRASPEDWVLALDSAFYRGDGTPDRHALDWLDEAAGYDEIPPTPAPPAPAPPLIRTDPPPSSAARIARSPAAIAVKWLARVVFGLLLLAVSFVLRVVPSLRRRFDAVPWITREMRYATEGLTMVFFVGIGILFAYGLGSAIVSGIYDFFEFDLPAGPKSTANLAVGDCVFYHPGPSTAPVVVGDCDDPHWGQVFALPVIVNPPVVTEPTVSQASQEACATAFTALPGETRQGMIHFTFYPNIANWDPVLPHRASCLLARPDGIPWTDSRVDS